MGITTAVALLPLLGRADSAIPSTQLVMTPEQEDPGEGQPLVGIRRQRDVEREAGDGQQQDGLQHRAHHHHADLADEVGDDRQRRAAQSLERSVALFAGDVDAQVLHPAEQHPGGDHARQVERGPADSAGAVGVLRRCCRRC